MLMKILLIVLGITMSNQKVLFNFNSNDEVVKWRKVNDTVMGGISKSSFELNENGFVKFTGILSPDNNGGFASFRTLLENDDLVGYEGVYIRVKGDGNIYNVRFRTTDAFDGYSYQAKFKSLQNEWIEIKIPFTDFQPTYRGRLLANKPELESKNIRQLGILIADKQFGGFELDIDWIKLY